MAKVKIFQTKTMAFMDIYIKWIAVLRDTARAPQPPTRQPNGHFWAKRSYYLGREQKFWYSHIRKPPWNLVRIVFFGQTWHQLDQKGQYLAKNDQYCIFQAKGAGAFHSAGQSKEG